MNSLQITIGTDPELFLKDASGNFVSAHDLIPGSKAKPHPVQHGAIQPDGVAAEFNTAPAATVEEFLTNVDCVIQSLQDTFKSVRNDLVIAITPTATFDREYFNSLPEYATELGCTPDFNAYTGKQNTPPSTDEPFRTGAGHFHVGWGKFKTTDPKHFQRCRELVMSLDTVLYFASLLWDDDNKRRSLYGKIGAFRPKSYGVEYRPLSNAYLGSEATKRLGFNITKSVSDLYLNHDKHLYKDSFAREMVEMVLSGGQPDHLTICEYLAYMHDTYDVVVE